MVLAEADKPGETIKLRTDAVVAHETREELSVVLREACAIMNRARAAGLTVNFSLPMDQHGRHIVSDISIVKPL